MKTTILSLWNDLLNLFFPNRCILCESTLVEGEKQLCTRCLNHLPYLDFSNQPVNPVESLLIDREKVADASAYLLFQQGGNVQRLIHSLKYFGNEELGFLLGRLAALKLIESGSPCCGAELIIPLPLHRSKQRKRGYNQSEHIARGMMSVMNIPVCTTAIRRKVKRESQTRMIPDARWENVKDNFMLTDSGLVAGKHLLLVDDVITSGATAAACIDALSAAEGVRISFFALSAALQ